MWDAWHVGGSQGLVVIQRWFSGALPAGGWLLEPHVAAARVEEWFPLGSEEMSSRTDLLSIATKVCLGAGPGTETRVLRAWVARAFHERALVACQLPAPETTFHARSTGERAPPPPAAPPPPEAE